MIAAHRAGSGPDVIGDDPVGTFGAAFGNRIVDQILGLGGKADDEARPLAARLGEGGQNVRILFELERSFASRLLLLQLLRGLVGGAPIGNGCGTYRDVGGERGEGGGQHLVRGLDLDHPHTVRIG